MTRRDISASRRLLSNRLEGHLVPSNGAVYLAVALAIAKSYCQQHLPLAVALATLTV